MQGRNWLFFFLHAIKHSHKVFLVLSVVFIFLYLFHAAASCGHNEVVLLLLTSGADKNISDNNGEIAQDVCDPNVRDLL